MTLKCAGTDQEILKRCDSPDTQEDEPTSADTPEQTNTGSSENPKDKKIAEDSNVSTPPASIQFKPTDDKDSAAHQEFEVDAEAETEPIEGNVVITDE